MCFKSRPGNLVDAMSPIEALGVKGLSLAYLATKAVLGQPVGCGNKISLFGLWLSKKVIFIIGCGKGVVKVR